MFDSQKLAQLDSPIAPFALIREQPSLIEGIPDGILLLIAPIVAYWSYSLFFHVIDVFELAEYYRIHPPEEITKRNKATQAEVVRDVILQHFIQTLAGLALFHFDPKPTTGYEVLSMWTLKQNMKFVPNFMISILYNLVIPAVKIFTAFALIDSWQFFLHRLMHINKALYKRFHSRHHRLYVPYAFGALYNDPVEGFLLDTLGSGLAAIVTMLTPRQQIILFTFSTLKTVDDHCGYSFPWDVFQIVFPNNSIYHDIHHQNFGIKNNFSQPFFTFWDKLYKTEYHGIDEYKQNLKKISIEKYHEFLNKRQLAKASSKKMKISTSDLLTPENSESDEDTRKNQ